MENKNEFVDIKINKEIYKILKLWNKERKEELKEKNWGTREPVFKVQTKEYIPTHENYGPDKIEICIDFGGDFNAFESLDDIKEHYHEDYFSSEDEYNEFMQLVEESQNISNLVDNFEDLEEDSKIKPDQFYLYCSQIAWRDQAYFLTYREASEYMKYQSHNLRVCRVYIDYPGYANKSTFNKFLEILDNNDIFEVK